MKVISKLRLTQLSKAELEARQMNVLFGGANQSSCSCNGPSLAEDNKSANTNYGISNCSCGCVGSSSASDNSSANASYGGGNNCSCGCSGVSSTEDNRSANSSYSG